MFSLSRTNAKAHYRNWLIVAVACLFAPILTSVALDDPINGLIGVYVVTFLFLSFFYPHVALLLIFASAPFQSDVSGGGGPKYSITEANIVLTLPAFYLRSIVYKTPISLGLVGLPVFLYLLVGVYSSWQHWWGSLALTSLVQMAIYLIVVVALFSSFLQDHRKHLWALNAAVIIGSFLGVYQLSGSKFLGLHKNGIGGSLCCALLIAVELWFASTNAKRKNWLLLAMSLILLGLLMTLSRGAWLGALGGIMVICSLRQQWVLLTRLLIVLAPLIALAWFLMPQQDRSYVTGFGKERENIRLRYESVDFAAKYFYSSPIYGSGVGLRKGYDATNVGMLTLAETGVLGLVAFGLIHVAVFQTVWRAQKVVPRQLPQYTLLVVAGAIVTSRLLHGMVDHYWGRGPVTMAWAATGMATGVYLAERRRRREGMIG